MSPSAGSGPELQQLARTILSMLDPYLQAAATAGSAVDGGTPGKCTQAWCPVCAVAAVTSGEHHPMAAMVAQHGVALLSLIRALAEPSAPGGDAPGAPVPPNPGSYQPIPVTIHE